MAHITANIMAHHQTSRFRTHSVQLNPHTSTALPLELQHLGIAAEYKELIEAVVNDVTGGRTLSYACLGFSIVCFVLVPVLVFTSAGPGSSKMYMVIPPALFVMVLFSIGVRYYAEKRIIENAQRRCDEINARPHLHGRIQFAFQSQSWGRRHVAHYLEVQYADDSPVAHGMMMAQQPVAGIPISVAVTPPPPAPAPAFAHQASYNPMTAASAPPMPKQESV